MGRSKCTGVGSGVALSLVLVGYFGWMSCAKSVYCALLPPPAHDQLVTGPFNAVNVLCERCWGSDQARSQVLRFGAGKILFYRGKLFVFIVCYYTFHL